MTRISARQNNSFAIIIPNYNNAKTLARAIESCLNQIIPANEIIVVDDGSTDESRAVLGKYSKEITTIFQKNSGVSTARNNGADQAKSEWLLFLDADDEFLPNRIASHDLQIKKFQPISAIIGDQYNFHEDTGKQIEASINSAVARSIAQTTERASLLTKTQMAQLLVEGPIEIRTLTIKRNFFRALNGFPENIKIGEDFHLFARIFTEGNVAYSADIVAKYNIHNESALRKNKLETQKKFIKTLEELENSAIIKSKTLQNGIKQRLELERISLAYALLREKKKMASIKYAAITAVRHMSIKSVRSLLAIIAH